MHFSLKFRGIGKVGFLLNRQCVNITAKRLNRSFFFSPYDCHKSRLQVIGKNLNACSLQYLTYLICGFIFLIGQFGISVKPLKIFSQFILKTVHHFLRSAEALKFPFFDSYPLLFGSSASLSASPIKLIAITSTTITTPGGTQSQGCFVSTVRDSAPFNIFPRLAVGG